MKQKIYILGSVVAIIMAAGAIFKVNHWAGAGQLLFGGTLIFVLLFLPAALINNYRAEGNRQNKVLYIMTYITCVVVFTAMLFKIQHWHYAGLALMIALPFPYVVYLPVFLIVTSKNKNFNIFNTVFVLMLLALTSVFTALLALNVSKETIADSINLSRNYCKVEAAMADLPASGGQTSVNLKIDEVLKTIKNYQDQIFNYEGITREQWKKDQVILRDAESTNTLMFVLTKNAEPNPGYKLHQELKELVTHMEQNRGYEAAAKAMPSILGLPGEGGADMDWVIRNLTGANLSWVLIYLDGLESNLKMIKFTTGSTL